MLLLCSFQTHRKWIRCWLQIFERCHQRIRNHKEELHLVRSAWSQWKWRSNSWGQGSWSHYELLCSTTAPVPNEASLKDNKQWIRSCWPIAIESASKDKQWRPSEWVQISVFGTRWVGSMPKLIYPFSNQSIGRMLQHCVLRVAWTAASEREIRTRSLQLGKQR